MINTQLATNYESIPKKSKKSSNKNSKSSIKLLTDSAVKGSNISVKRKLKSKKKTRRTLRNQNSKEDSDTLSSGKESDTSVPTRVQRKKRRTKRIVRKSRIEPEAGSLAKLGREYGNTVSKQNVLKAAERTQSANKLNQQTSLKTASREYGDFFSWQTGVSYLENNRIDIINSKGIKHFTDEYTRKLQKCQEFESGHHVEPFASARLELLKKGFDANRSKIDVVDENFQNIEVDKGPENTENYVATDSKTDTKTLSVSTLKTIELIRKFKSGQSIAGDLHMSKKNESSLNNIKSLRGQRTAKSRSRTNKNRSSKENEKLLKKPSDKSDKTKNEGANAKKAESDKITTVATITKQPTEQLSQEEKTSEKSVRLSYGNTGQNSMNYLKLSERKENLSGNSELSNSQSDYVVMKKVLMSTENSITIVEGRKRYDSLSRGAENNLENNFSGRKLPVTRGRPSVGQGKNVNSIETLYRSEGVLRMVDDKRMLPFTTRRSK